MGYDTIFLPIEMEEKIGRKIGKYEKTIFTVRDERSLDLWELKNGFWCKTIYPIVKVS